MPKEIGIQSYTFRKFSIEDSIRMTADLGMQAIEIWPNHLPVNSSPDKTDEIRHLLDEKSIRVCGMGQFSIGSDRGETEQAIRFARLFGVDYLTITLDKRCDKAAVEHLVRTAEDSNILLGLHNHGPKDRFGEPEAILETVRGYPETFGACVDTGHYLRSGKTPEEAVKLLGKRVHGVHLKDFLDEKNEVAPGTGRLSFPVFLAALKKHTGFHSAFILEYEANPLDPMAAMKSAVGDLKKALEGW